MPGFALEQYVNDRPYSAASYLSVAISRVFGTALSGKCSKRPELVEQALPLCARLAALPSRGGPAIPERLFQPLGYSVETTRHPLDERFPEWGDSPYYALQLQAEKTLKELLSHLYVLVPVLDDNTLLGRRSGGRQASASRGVLARGSHVHSGPPATFWHRVNL